MTISIEKYQETDIPEMNAIWNEVVEEGIAFPQLDCLNETTGKEFFASQTYCAVARDTTSKHLVGLYILHPNNVGRCGHIGNVSYTVLSSCRGKKVGESLVKDSLVQAKEHGFRLLQLNAVVKTNLSARHLYEKLGYVSLGIVPGGFLMKDGHYEDICLYYYKLV